MESICQLYQYKKGSIDKQEFSASEFVEHFSLDDLPKDKISWINFYIQDDLEPIEAFCKKFNYDVLVY